MSEAAVQSWGRHLHPAELQHQRVYTKHGQKCTRSHLPNPTPREKISLSKSPCEHLSSHRMRPALFYLLNASISELFL